MRRNTLPFLLQSTPLRVYLPKQSLLKQNRNGPKRLSPLKLNKSSAKMAASEPCKLPEDYFPKLLRELGLHFETFPDEATEAKNRQKNKLKNKSAVQAVEKRKVPPKAASPDMEGRPSYVYRALREDELIAHKSVCLQAKGKVKEATPSLETIEMAVVHGWGPSPFIHTTTSPTAALWFARSSSAMRSSGKIAKFDLRNFEGRVYDLSSQNRFLEPRSKADFFARCFSEVLLQGPPGRSDRLWDGILTKKQIRVVQVWDVSDVEVPRSRTFREFQAELRQFSCVNDFWDEMKQTNPRDTRSYTGGAGSGVPYTPPQGMLEVLARPVF